MKKKCMYHLLGVKRTFKESRRWWHTLVIPALERQRHHEFKASVGCIARPSLKQINKTKGL
jgi:hypothetical protein